MNFVSIKIVHQTTKSNMAWVDASNRDELDYWGIDELLLEPCCALKYYPEIELCFKEVEGEEESRKKTERRKMEEDFGNSKIGRIRKYLWNLTEYPETSKAAQVAAFVSLGVILISTLVFILSTLPELQDAEDGAEEDEKTGDDNAAAATATDVTEKETRILDDATGDGSDAQGNSWIDFSAVTAVLRVIDTVTVFYFFLEYVVRFLCSPLKRRFFFQPMNFVDFLAILPYVVSSLIESMQDLQILGKAGKIMRLVRVMRILRIFKLVRHFAGLQSLIYTLKQAYKELGLLLILVGVAVLTFSSLVFYAEKDSTVFKWTFLDSFWWGLMTLTTVGYGTQAPASLTGKAIGGVCAVCGVFILTLPVPIVVNSFASYYKNRLWRNEVAHKRLLRAQEQTRKVKEILSSRHPSMDGVPLPHFERRGSVRSLRAGTAEDPAEMRLCIEKLKMTSGHDSDNDEVAVNVADKNVRQKVSERHLTVPDRLIN